MPLKGMRTIKLTLEYDGTCFHGWQAQPGRTTVQGEVQKALERITGENVSLIGAGRTDAGVHALGQVASFRTRASIPLQGLLKGLNSMLPDGVAVVSCEEAPETFHPIRDACYKIYVYHILVVDPYSPIWGKRAWIIPRDIDPESVRKAAAIVVGRHDFASFQASGSDVKSSIREVYMADFSTMDKPVFPGGRGRHYLFTIAADGFLRYMVRNITGTLVEIGLGTRPWHDMEAIISARDRGLAGRTAPPQGLYLKEVSFKPYEENE